MTSFRAILTIGGAVLALALGAAWLFDRGVGSKPYAIQPQPERSRAEVIEACNAHIRNAEIEARAAIDRRAAEFVAFIDERKGGAAAFSGEVVSWYGKWRAIKAYLPFTDGDGHRQYIEEQFGEHIFSNAELATAAELAVTGSLKDLEAIENRLAVTVRAEIADRPVSAMDLELAPGEFAAAIERVMTASRWDAAKAGGSLIVSEVAAVVGTQVLVRLGVSAGVLAAGAANSVWTLGGSIVVGLIADLIWGWIDDPAGDIERETVAALDQLAAESSAAMRAELGNVVTQRSEIWCKAVEEMVP